MESDNEEFRNSQNSKCVFCGCDGEHESKNDDGKKKYLLFLIDMGLY